MAVMIRFADVGVGIGDGVARTYRGQRVTIPAASGRTSTTL